MKESIIKDRGGESSRLRRESREQSTTIRSGQLEKYMKKYEEIYRRRFTKVINQMSQQILHFVNKKKIAYFVQDYLERTKIYHKDESINHRRRQQGEGGSTHRQAGAKEQQKNVDSKHEGQPKFNQEDEHKYQQKIKNQIQQLDDLIEFSNNIRKVLSEYQNLPKFNYFHLQDLYMITAGLNNFVNMTMTLSSEDQVDIQIIRNLLSQTIHNYFPATIIKKLQPYSGAFLPESNADKQFDEEAPQIQQQPLRHDTRKSYSLNRQKDQKSTSRGSLQQIALPSEKSRDADSSKIRIQISRSKLQENYSRYVDDRNKSDIVEMRIGQDESESEEQEEDMSYLSSNSFSRNKWEEELLLSREKRKQDVSQSQRKASAVKKNCVDENPSFSEMSELESHQNALKQQVGLLVCVWFGRNGKQVSITSLASAFAISSRIIVTCAHAMVESLNLRPCDKAYFFPPNGKFYETENSDFQRYKPIESNTRYGQKPLIQDVAVMVLKDQLPEGPFLELSSEPLEKGAKIQVWGHPSEDYKLDSFKREINSLVHEGDADIPDIKRKDVQGIYLDSAGSDGANYVLVHTAPTQKGHSGSPILQMGGSDKDIKVVGIHTHRAYGNTNEGLSMVSLHATIQRYRKELLQSHNICERQQRAQLQTRKVYSKE